LKTWQSLLAALFIDYYLTMSYFWVMGRKSTGGHVRFLGGKTQYRIIRVNGKQCLEHRVVMEGILGRKLAPSEIVHHKDGNGLNNSPDNLELFASQGIHRIEHSGPFHWNLDEAIKMRGEGATIRAVAKHFCVTESAINKALKRRGYSTNTPRKLRFDRAFAINAFHQDLPVSHIAKLLGVAAPSIKKALEKTGDITPKHSS
jgi:hypothetical protein